MPAADVTVTATFRQVQQVVTNETITGEAISGVSTNVNGDYVIDSTGSGGFKGEGVPIT